MIIHVEKTFQALHCQKCGKYFKKKQRITDNLKKKHITFFSFKLKLSRFQTHFIKSKTSQEHHGFNNRNLSHKTLKDQALANMYSQYSLCKRQCAATRQHQYCQSGKLPFSCKTNISSQSNYLFSETPCIILTNPVLPGLLYQG